MGEGILREQLTELLSPVMQPCTLRADVSGWRPHTRVDLEQEPIRLIVDDGQSLSVRDATEQELQSLSAWLVDHPQHPQELTPIEMLDRFTDAEQDAIESNAKRLARRLFGAIEPISWEVFAASVEELRAGGLLTSEQAERVLK
jgi:hypothetical protein